MVDTAAYKVRVRLHREIRAALFLRQAESGRSLHAEINHVLRKALTPEIARAKRHEENKGDTPCTPPK